MRFKRLFILNYTFILIFLVILGLSVFLMLQIHKQFSESQETRFRSHLIADELKTSSEELTRFCRTYVETGDSIWEKRYWELLSIRNGKLPWPNGRTIALQDSMKKLGFTRVELDKLRQAERNSNDLVWTERVAFNAVKGLFADEQGQFTIRKAPDSEMARRIVFDKKYHADKEKIMKPIDECIVLIDSRTQQAVEKEKRLSYTILVAISVLIILICIVAGIAFFVLRNKLVRKHEDLEISYKKIEESENHLRKQNEELDKQVEISKMANELILEQNKKLDELIASKDRFFSIISHDLRGTVGTLGTFSQMIHDKAQEMGQSALQNDIRKICDTTAKINSLLNNLLTWAKLQSSKFQTHPVKLNLAQLTKYQIDLHSLISREKEIQVILSGSFDVLVTADKDQLEFVIRNLLSNALKFTPRRGKVNLTISSVSNNGYTARMVVKDSGVGMDEQQLEKLFLISELQTTNGTEGEEGSGLGLILCKEFIDKNQGAINVESEPGVGTSFIIDLP
jgi:signal transduction histidine kinase